MKSLPIVETNFGIFCILTILKYELILGMVEIWMKIHLVSDSNCNFVHGTTLIPTFFYKEWQTMLGLHLVLGHYTCCLLVVLSHTNRTDIAKYNI